MQYQAQAFEPGSFAARFDAMDAMQRGDAATPGRIAFARAEDAEFQRYGSTSRVHVEVLMDDAVAHALECLDEPAMLAFLRDLVRAPSVFLPGVEGANEERAARLVYDQLAAWG